MQEIKQEVKRAKYGKLIGICGNAGVGKDTVGDYLDENFEYVSVSFALAVKVVCCEAFGISWSNFQRRELKETTNEYWNLSPREMAQKVGTELFRKAFGDDFWIRRLEFDFIKEYDSPADVRAVITDVRFNNEAQWILDSGGVLLHLTRPGYTGNVGIPQHASEAGIDFDSLTYEGDKDEVIFKIENIGTKLELLSSAKSFIEKLERR